MQQWWDSFSKRFSDAEIEILHKAIYIDDSRLIVEILKHNVYFNMSTGKFEEHQIETETDTTNLENKIKHIEIEFANELYLGGCQLCN